MCVRAVLIFINLLVCSTVAAEFITNCRNRKYFALDIPYAGGIIKTMEVLKVKSIPTHLFPLTKLTLATEHNGVRRKYRVMIYGRCYFRKGTYKLGIVNPELGECYLINDRMEIKF